MMRILSCALSPNTQEDDVMLSVKTIFNPFKWINGDAIQRVSAWFKTYFQSDSVSFFDSGRSALYALLKAFDIKTGDEVLLQAFTCVAVPNSVIWRGAKPVYVDIDDSYNMDPADVQKKITKYTKAIIVQHTFGIPANMDNILRVARRYNLIVIEDCAHSLGETYKGKKIGTFGDAAFFSFGRDKVVSSVWGGAAIIRSKSTNKILQKDMEMPGYFWIFQQLFHPIAFSFILPLYKSGIGKMFLVFLQKLHLLSIPIYKEEKYGKKPEIFPEAYPNALAILLANQLKKLDKYTKNRIDIVKLYNEKLKKNISELGLLRYPYLVSDPQKVIARAKENGILLGNWYHNVIDPNGVDMEKIMYKKGSCPKAEFAALHIVNLPTRITRSDALKVIASVI